LRRAGYGAGTDFFQHGDGRASYLQPLHIEENGKQGPSIHVHQMPTRQIAPKRAASHQRLPLVICQRYHFDARAIEGANPEGASGEEDRLSSRKNLRPAMRALLWLTLGDLLGRAASGGDLGQAT